MGWLARLLISNAAGQVFLAVNDEATAEKVSRLLGERTVEVRSAGINTGADTVLARHEQAGIAEAARRLLQPSEVLRLGPDRQIVLLRGLAHPILAARVQYHRERCFAGLWDRWRDGPAPVAPLMLTHAPLRLEVKALRIGYRAGP